MRTLTHYLRFMAGWDEPHSQVSIAELEVLRREAAAARTIVEIGTFEGKTAVALAKASPGHVYSIDTFPAGRIGISYGMLIAKSARQRSGVSNLTYIRGRSDEVGDQVQGDVDLLFVDADHSYEGLRRDWELWTARLRPGGLVALHDVVIAPNSPVPLGSMQFFEEKIRQRSDYSIVQSVGCLVLLRKSADRA